MKKIIWILALVLLLPSAFAITINDGTTVTSSAGITLNFNTDASMTQLVTNSTGIYLTGITSSIFIYDSTQVFYEDSDEGDDSALRVADTYELYASDYNLDPGGGSGSNTEVTTTTIPETTSKVSSFLGSIWDSIFGGEESEDTTTTLIESDTVIGGTVESSEESSPIDAEGVSLIVVGIVGLVAYFVWFKK